MAFEGLAQNVFMSEIEKFPRAVLQHHFPDNTLFGDFTKLINNPIPCDVLVGGIPCQAWSFAGKRESLNDPRGQLALRFVELFNAVDELNMTLGLPPCTCLIENVPGLLSTKDNAFGHLLGALVGFNRAIVNPNGRKWPSCGVVMGPKRRVGWRILDAQHFGLAQRRKRVFIVASARNGFDPTTILLEQESMQRNYKKGRKERKDITGTLNVGNPKNSLGTDFELNGGLTVSLTGIASYKDSVLPTLRANGGDQAGGSETLVAFGGVTSGPIDKATTQTAHERWDFESETFVTSFNWQSGGDCRLNPLEEQASTLQKDQTQAVIYDYDVRRLTPIECERLQGFPDCWTWIPNAAKRKKLETDFLQYIKRHMPDISDEEAAKLASDGPRYKALGNAFAVPVVRWIAERLAKHLEDLNA